MANNSVAYQQNELVGSKERKRWATIALTLTICINLLLATIKVVIALLINSVSLLADAIDSFSDLFTGFIAYLGIQWASQPADENHHFGHEKGEIMSSMIIGGVLLMSATYILTEAWGRFQTGEVFEFSSWGLLAAGISVVGKAGLSFILFAISKRIQSASIKAEALNYRMDIITSISVLVAMGGAFFGLGWLDFVVGGLVALLITWTAIGVFREALRVILDEAPEGLVEEVENLSRGIEGLVELTEVRVRQLGQRTIADCRITVPSTMSVEEAHEVTVALEKVVYQKTEISELLVHVDPTKEPSGME